MVHGLATKKINRGHPQFTAPSVKYEANFLFWDPQRRRSQSRRASVLQSETIHPYEAASPNPDFIVQGLRYGCSSSHNPPLHSIFYMSSLNLEPHDGRRYIPIDRLQGCYMFARSPVHLMIVSDIGLQGVLVRYGRAGPQPAGMDMKYRAKLEATT